MTRRYVIEIPESREGFNGEFQRGWVEGLLGMAAPEDDESARVGHETAMETMSVAMVGMTIKAMVALDHLRVRCE